MKKNPLAGCKEIRVHRRPPTFLQKRDIPRFLASIKDIDLRRLVTAYISTGRRRSELLNLKWKDVNIGDRRYTVKTKGGIWQTYYINKLFLNVLKSVRIGSGSGHKDKRLFKSWHPDTVSHKTKKALVDFGFPGHHLHSLRHTFASLKAAEGRSLKEIQDLLGHQEIKATLLYSHLTDDHLSEISEIEIGPVELNKR